MNYKIIDTNPELPNVLLYRDRDEEGLEVVNILAIGTVEEEDDQFAIETVKFANGEAAQQFVADFSNRAAESFCERNDVKY